MNNKMYDFIGQLSRKTWMSDVMIFFLNKSRNTEELLEQLLDENNLRLKERKEIQVILMGFHFKITGPLMNIIEEKGITPREDSDDLIEVSETEESVIVDISHPEYKNLCHSVTAIICDHIIWSLDDLYGKERLCLVLSTEDPEYKKREVKDDDYVFFHNPYVCREKYKTSFLFPKKRRLNTIQR